MTSKEALRRVLFLKHLPDEVISMVAAAGKERSLQKGEMLFAEHAPCLGLIVVLTGAIKIYKLDARGRELTLGMEGPGASVEELPLFDGGNYPAGAEAVKDDTSILIVSRAQFQQLMHDHPEIAQHALRALAIRIRRSILIIEAQSLHTVRARLAAYILGIAHGRTVVSLDETNEAIASQIGTVRDVVSRTLGNLRDAGAIALRGRSVTILQEDILRRIAEAGDLREPT